MCCFFYKKIKSSIIEASITYTLEQVPAAAQRLLELAGNKQLFALTGDLGAGKTTLIKALCAELKVVDTVSSPTFSIINEYRSSTGTPIYHIDLYRLQDQEEAIGIGLEDYLYSDAPTFVEWPEVAEDLFPEEGVIRIHLENSGNSARKIIFL